MHKIIAVPFDEELAAFIGKKGSVNSITFFNRNYNGNTIVALMPSNINEKFYALPEMLLVAPQVVLSTKSIDRLFGEVLVACQLLGRRILLTNDNDASQLASFYRKDLIEIVSRNEILDKIVEYGTSRQDTGDVRIDIDKSFNVKGVGTVVLGVVSKGVVKRHDTLFHTSGKEVSVRSIQSQDQDIDSVGEETRVGLALKGIEADEIRKGDILASTKPVVTDKINATIEISNFVSEEMLGKSYGLALAFSYINAKVEEVYKNKIKLRLEKPIAIQNNDRFLLVRDTVPRIFAAGTAAL